MAKHTNLVGWDIGARKAAKLVEAGENGEPATEEMWQILLIERGTNDRITFEMNRVVRDELVRQLTGGIVLAGGDLPQL